MDMTLTWTEGGRQHRWSSLTLTEALRLVERIEARGVGEWDLKKRQQVADTAQKTRKILVEVED